MRLLRAKSRYNRKIAGERKKGLEISLLRGVNKVNLYETTYYIRVLERKREKK